MSYHMTCHVTMMSCASSLSKRKNKEKEKENQYKIRKIKENKNKNYLCPKHSITVLVIIMISDTSRIWIAWLISYLIAKSLALIDVMLTVWWIVFLTSLEWQYICEINIVTLFLTLVLDITTTNLRSDDISEKVLSSLQRWAALLSLSLQFAQWKEKQLEKLSTNREPRENSLLRELKNEKIPLRQLFTSTIELLILSLYFSVIFSKDRWWREKLLACLFCQKWTLDISRCL